jgi:hypothetical protein
MEAGDTCDLRSPGLRTVVQSGKAGGDHRPHMALDRIVTTKNTTSFDELSIRLHETVHAGQYAKMPFGLWALWSAVEQGRLAASAYRQRHPVVHVPDPHEALAPLDDADGIEGTKCEHLRLWKKLELLAWLFDHRRKQTTLALSGGDLGSALKKIAGADFDALDALPESVWTPYPHEHIQVLGHRFYTRYPFPAGERCLPFGAYGLLESSAIAAQLACFGAIPTVIGCTDPLYHTGQDLFLSVLGDLDDVFGAGLMDKLPLQIAAYPGHPPLQNLFDLIVYNLERIPEHARLHCCDTVQRVSLLFFSLVELALSTPIGPAFSAVNRGLHWHDLHPGWRFVRALGVMRELLEFDNDARFLWLSDCDRLQDQVCNTLGWPTRLVMGERLVNWVAYSLPEVLRQHTAADVIRLRARSLHVALGLARTCAWLPRVVFNKAHGIWEAGEERSRRLRSSWSTEWQHQLGTDQSISVHHRTGRCIWEVHHFPQDRSSILCEADCRAFLDRLWRPQTLAEAIEAEFFHLEILRMLYFGSGDVSPVHALLDTVCGDDCLTRRDVAAACERLVKNVWRYQIYT